MVPLREQITYFNSLEYLAKAKKDLLNYLQEGESFNGLAIVRRTELRTHLLKAGYSSLALGNWFGTSHTINGNPDTQTTNELHYINYTPEDIKNRQIFNERIRELNRPTPPEIVIGPDIYELGGGWHDVTQIQAVVQIQNPTEDDFADERRVVALEQIQTVANLKLELSNKGKRTFSLDDWEIDGNAGTNGRPFTLHFWLNPINQDLYNSGWITPENLEQWLNNEGPVIKEQEI